MWSKCHPECERNCVISNTTPSGARWDTRHQGVSRDACSSYVTSLGLSFPISKCRTWLGWRPRRLRLCAPGAEALPEARARRAGPGRGGGTRDLAGRLELPSCSSAVFSAARRLSSQPVTAIFPPPSRASHRYHDDRPAQGHFRMTRKLFWSFSSPLPHPPSVRSHWLPC